MSRFKTKMVDRVLSILLTLIMVVGMMPITAFASTAGTLSTDIDQKVFNVEQATEFTFSTTANDDVGVMVRGSFEFSEPGAISKLEYLETKDDNWYEFYGDFGPETGFPMMDATSRFRVTFNKPGNYSLIASVKRVDNGECLCSITESVLVVSTPAVLSTDIGDKDFYTEESTEFTFSTKANDAIGVNVLGYFEFSNPEAISKLEYFETKDNKWYEFYGDFGPSKGFPLSDATSKFRVTFSKPGNYDVEVFVKRADNNTLICSTGKIGLSVIDKYKVTVSTSVGGSFTLDGKDINILSVPNGTVLPLKVSAKEGYQISSVFINGVEQIIENKTNFNKDITINADTNISILFDKVYTITVQYTGEGNVDTNPKCEGGIVVVKKDTSVNVVATPNQNYRVSEVRLNDAVVNTIKGNNDEYYEFEFSADKDYKFEITFAPNRYDVTAIKTDNGSIMIENSKVNYSNDCKVNIYPNPGYTVESAKVNNVDIVVEAPDDVTTYFVIPSITEDKEVVVTFKKAPTTDMSNVSFNSSDAVRANMDGTLFVFNKDAVVTFSTDKTGIMIYDVNGNPIGGGYFKKNVKISSTKSIGEIKLYYKDSNDIISTWHSVNVISAKNPLNIIIDRSAPTVQLNPEKANSKGYYSSDVSIDISVEDVDDYSGIASVEYWATKDGIETQREVIYSYTGTEITNIFKGNVVVKADKNNSDNVKAYLKVTDRAGNEEIVNCDLKINASRPVVNVSIDGTLHNEAVKGYYNTPRTAVVTYIDRNSTFDSQAAYDGIKIGAKNFNGENVPISKASMIDINSNGNTHTFTINFDEDAIYDWSIDYKNKADLSIDGISTTMGESAYHFVIDKNAPENVSINLDGNIWSEIIKTLTFGIWKNYNVIANAYAEDSISEVKNILYYKSNSNEKLLISDLDRLFEDGLFVTKPITVLSDEKFVIYARITDYAGNTKYISTDGIVYDNTKSKIVISPSPANANGFYNSDVEINVDVYDALKENVDYSGLRSIDYSIECEGTEITSENLWKFDIDNPSYDELVSEVTGKKIIVDSKKYNSDKVVVTVYATDNAGNLSEEHVVLSINTDAPTVNITFTDIANMVVGNHGYFGAYRKAEITVLDRNSTFDEAAATNGIKIDSAVDAKNIDVSLSDGDVIISEWNNNGDMHTATVTFKANANYNWHYTYTNLADMSIDANDGITTGESVTPFDFTVDTVTPTGSVKVNENKWDVLLNELTFGLYSKISAKVVAKSEDETSPVYIEYYKTSDIVAKDDSELDEIYLQGKFSDFTELNINSNEIFVVYLRITDYSGNHIYLNSDGYIVDSELSEIELTYDKANEKGLYKDNINVDISVKDSEPYSGIQQVEYWVETNGVKTIEKTLYSFDYIRDEGDNSNGGKLTVIDWDSKKLENTAPHEYVGKYPVYSMLKNEWSGSIVIDAEENNGCDVVLHVKTVDNAGNETEKVVTFDIDASEPIVDLTYDNNDDNSGNSFFNAKRKATLVVTERKHHFDAEAATKGIKITAVDANGKEIKDAYQLSSWEEKINNDNPDLTTYTLIISYNKDANYTFDFEYKDEADNINRKPINTHDSVSPYKFTVDTVAPYGTVKAKSAEGREVEWNNLVDNDLTFGFWSKKKINISGTSNDDTSPIASVEYYKVSAKNAHDGTVALTETELNAVTDWKQFKDLDVLANEQFIVYIKITDKAGNYKYISTDGLIVDDQAPIEETIAPKITISPEQPINGFYNGDVDVDISVKEPLVGGTYSGIKTVSYTVYNLGVVTQSGTLYSFDIQNPKQDDLCKNWNGKVTIDSELNNSNDVVIEVYAEDNSLNSSKDDTSIMIDVTAPTIDVSYDNNNVDSGKYFKANRTATIVVTERNFNAEDVNVSITNTDGVIPKLSNWEKVEGTGNLDDTTWIAKIYYDVDGDYTFGIDYTDLANNICVDVEYGDSVSPISFTLDKTIPTVKVTYDNYNALNNNYYKDNRIATIEINEHNFNTNRIKIMLTATDDGNSIAPPTVSGWITDGDVHTATISYMSDACYNFDIEYIDLAGNEIADFAKQMFYVDKTAPTLDITGIVDNSANSGDVIPVITYSDTNFDVNNISMNLVGANRKDVSPEGNRFDIHNGVEFTFNNFEKKQEVDDIYTLSAKLTDLAGNSTEKKITFSVNRFGSTYALSDEVEKLNGSYVKTPVDVVITETNANSLKNITITLFKNNETIVLKEGPNYRIDVSGGNGKWYHYTYTIFKENFVDDGVYRLTIHSEDGAGNIAENTLDTKGTEVNFGIDKTNPNIVVTNLESGTTYALDKLSVIMSVSDNLLVKSLAVYLDDYNTAYKAWTSEEIAEIISLNGEFTFDISGDSNSAHNIKVVCVDAAGNEQIEEINDFFVTTNLWVRYYTNTPLFIGSIVGAVVLVMLIIFLILYKRKKSEEKSV